MLTDAEMKVKKLRGFNSSIFIILNGREDRRRLKEFFDSLLIFVNIPTSGVVRVARSYKAALPFSSLFGWGISKEEYGAPFQGVRSVSVDEFLKLQEWVKDSK